MVQLYPEVSETCADWYPISLHSFIDTTQYICDTYGNLFYHDVPVTERATTVFYALARWNAYTAMHEEADCTAFLALARRCIEQREEQCGAEQLGCELSLLTRAYLFTGDEDFLQATLPIAACFERDLFDGGIVAPVGTEGVFFEEVRAYPATHALRAHLFALFGLLDYVELTHDQQLATQFQYALATLRMLLTEFDRGFWISTELLHHTLATPLALAQSVLLLQGLAARTGDTYYQETAARWQYYTHSIRCHLRYLATRTSLDSAKRLRAAVNATWVPSPKQAEPHAPLRACVTVNAFPVLGGIRTVLLGIEDVTRGLWQMEYLTRFIGPDAAAFTIHRFGSAARSPWHAHTVWLYVLDGCRGLLDLFRRGADYQVLLPQDGVYTAAFTGLIARLVGARVVCIDHAYLTMLNNPSYQHERIQELSTRPWYIRMAGRVLFPLYWPSMYMLAWLAARCVDAYFIPGIAGDGVEASCARLGIPASRITRFASMIDLEQHPLLQESQQQVLRHRMGLPDNAIVIALVCRLAPEKGLDIAVAAIEQALTQLEPQIRQRVRVVIAGDGPGRGELVHALDKLQLHSTCSLWGTISHQEALQLLSISDIFLNTSVRGTCFPMSILEAMASACAVIASTQPVSNGELLRNGRGLAVPAGDITLTAQALVQLLTDEPLRHTLGQTARRYIAMHHSPTQFQRSLQRVTHWTPAESPSK